MEFLLNKEHKISGKEIILKECIFCGNDNFKLYVNSESGAFDCKVCSEHGGIRQLKKAMGIGKKEIDYNSLHDKLMSGEDGVLDYLVVDRHLTEETIKHFKLGSYQGNLWIPFLKSNKLIYYKVRILEPAEGESKYKNATGSVPLFNAEVITEDLEELFIVEGEIDAMSLHQLGYHNVVAVPGANTKKHEWLRLIDKSNIKKIYLIYDRDEVGQRAAQQMAEKIGIQKCWNVLVPSDKDINELLAEENARDLISSAIEEAEQFQLEGVKNTEQTLKELKEDFSGNGIGATYTTSWWPSLAKKLGGYEPGDLIGLLAQAKCGKTSAAINWAYQHCKLYKEPVGIFCLEMPGKRILRKMVSYVTQTDDSFSGSKLNEETLEQAREVFLQDGVYGDQFIFIEKPPDIKDVFRKIEDVVRIYGIKFLVFDNLHLLVRDVQNQVSEINVLSKKFKELSMKLNIPILLILQPHRVQEGKIISAYNVHGSSGIEKDVDVMICLHRNRILSGLTEDEFSNMGGLETEEVFQPEMLVKVDLSRYSSGGTCVLYMDGARSTVREIIPEKTEPIKINMEIV